MKVVRVISSAMNTPEVESSADARMASGAAKVPNSNSRTMNTRTIARTQHKHQVARMISVASCRCRRTPREWQRADANRPPPSGRRRLALPRSVPSRRAVTETSRCKILPANFGLRRKLGDRGQGPQGCGLAAAAGQQSVANGLERSAISGGKADPYSVGTVVADTTGVVGWFAFEDGGGIGRDLFGSESRAGGDDWDRSERYWRAR